MKKFKKTESVKKILQLSILLISYYSIAQPTIAWQKCLGGSQGEQPYSLKISTSDGGSIIGGQTQSNDGDVSGNKGNADVWVVKISNLGVIEWQKCIGGTDNERANSIQQTTDGGYILAGYTLSNDVDVSGNHGIEDAWVVKLSSLGIIEWQKCIGGTNNERANSIIQTSGGGYILAGYTSSPSNGIDVVGNHGNYDAWVVKLSSLGIIEWSKCLGGTSGEYAYSIQQTTDGGYILACESNGINGDVTVNRGNSDLWLVKLASTGVIYWQKSIGGSLADYCYSIQQTTDGGYILVGSTMSNNIDVFGNHGNSDVWVVKTTSLGAIEWQKCLGGTNDERANSIKQTIDGGYVLAGETRSINGDVSGLHGTNKDAWVVKISNLGIMEWQKCLGGNNNDYANSIEQTNDGGYLLGSVSASYDLLGDVTGLHNNDDFWVVKLNSFLGIEEPLTNSLFTLYPNPVTNILNIYVVDDLINQIYNISDVGGKLIAQGNLNDNCSSINLEHLSKGVYFIKVAENKVIKFIKE